jgi:hypothetical protein
MLVLGPHAVARCCLADEARSGAVPQKFRSAGPVGPAGRVVSHPHHRAVQYNPGLFVSVCPI